jgi:uncharacterized membrane protein
MTVSILILGIILHPTPREQFTILYFTEPMSLQREVKVNEPFYVNFTVINHEYEACEYRYEIFLDDKKVGEGFLTLSHNESKEISKIVMPREAKNETEVSVILYKGGLANPYRSIRYFVNVRELGG